MVKTFKVDPHALSDQLVNRIAGCLQKKVVFVYPTETFYALGAHYDDGLSITRVFDVKQRVPENPLPLLIPKIDFLSNITERVDDAAFPLAERFWPGPLTLVFRARKDLNTMVTAGTGKVGCRVCGLAAINCILSRMKTAVTATSANLSGRQSVTEIDSLDRAVLNSADIIVDGGQTAGGLPSTVLDVSEEPFKVLRNGAVSFASLQRNCSVEILAV